MNPSPRPSADPPAIPSPVGVEWVVEAWGCDPARLRDPAAVRGLCDRLLGELELRAVAPPLWHAFPGPGGVTGLYLLAESHLACHTYPEHALATLNLYCCRPRRRWPWEDRLAEHLGAGRVTVRPIERGGPFPPPLEGEGGSRSEPGEGNKAEDIPSPAPAFGRLPLSLKGRGEEAEQEAAP